MTLNVYSIACLAPAVLALVLMTRVWAHRTRPGATAVSALLLAISVWSGAYAMELAGSAMEWKLFWGKVQYLGIATVPVAWFAFALAYSGTAATRRAEWIRWASWVPALTVLLAWTNDSHLLLWEHWEVFENGALSVTIYRYGPWFPIHVTYATPSCWWRRCCCCERCSVCRSTTARAWSCSWPWPRPGRATWPTSAS